MTMGGQTEADVEGRREELAQAMFDHIPVGVGSQGIIPTAAADLEAALEMGMDWSLREVPDRPQSIVMGFSRHAPGLAGRIGLHRLAVPFLRMSCHRFAIASHLTSSLQREAYSAPAGVLPWQRCINGMLACGV